MARAGLHFGLGQQLIESSSRADCDPETFTRLIMRTASGRDGRLAMFHHKCRLLSGVNIKSIHPCLEVYKYMATTVLVIVPFLLHQSS